VKFKTGSAAKAAPFLPGATRAFLDTQAISSQKREANAMVVEMMLPAGHNAEKPQHHSAPSGKEKEEVGAVNRLFYLSYGRHDWIRTSDLFRVKEAL
jgi:hypothetical protein